MTGKQGLKQCPIFREKGDINITSDFGPRAHPISGNYQWHSGIDAVRNNDSLATIVAIEDGLIIDCEKSVEGYSEAKSCGNYVRIRHSSGRQSMYLHLAYGTTPDQIAYNKNVRKGQMLGMMGSTGTSTGAHVHFQVYDTDGKTIIDPKPFIFGTNINYLQEETEMFIKIVPCKYTDRGPDVLNLQKKLSQLSAELEEEIKTHSYVNGALDGVFGAGMIATIQKLQAQSGLEPTGECDEEFCKLLNSNVVELKARQIEAIDILAQ